MTVCRFPYGTLVTDVRLQGAPVADMKERIEGFQYLIGNAFGSS